VFSLRLLPFGDGICGERSTKAHRLDRGKRDDNHRSLFTDCFIKHVDAAQMQSAWIFLLNTRRLDESLGDLYLSFAKNGTCLALALGLCLLGHGIFE
jgi:hypothetical protein